MEAAMDPARQGEIALKLVKLIIKDAGIHLRQNELNRKLGNVAKDIEVSPEELKEFVRPMLQEMLDAALK